MSDQYQSGVPLIPSQGLKGRDGHPYLPDGDLLAAGNVAATLEIPLLLTGEPGCGKTDFAYAIASWLHPDLPLVECHVHSDSRARDLLYRYDAERRFGDAQHGGEAGRTRAEDARNYIELRGLGLAMMSTRRRVVLIDEIDKAPRDLPNDLLRELDRWSFEIPELNSRYDSLGAGGVQLQREMVPPRGTGRPLVIITSNVERQLPNPFLRRCAFFHIRFPDEARLLKIVQGQFREPPAGLRLDQLVRVFLGVRAIPKLSKPPATSELLDWTRALAHLYAPERTQAIIQQLYGALEVSDGQVVVRRGAQPRWRELPGLFCLLKLAEDVKTMVDASA